MGTALQLSGYSGSQIALIKRTVAKDTNDDEFSLFMETARAFRLDPLRKQISVVVFSKDNAEKRQMAIIVSRDGYRVIASRCGDYRAASEPPEFEYDEALVSPANPAGIVKAMVRLWKRDPGGEWFPVVGEAYWNEFAPVREIADDYEWIDTGQVWADTGKPKKRKVPRGEAYMGVDPTSNWGRMPRLMIAKCAESQALRAGWPDAFGGLYTEEEMHRSEMIDITASEIVAQEAELQRAERIGGRGILISFDPTTNRLENVPAGQMADRCLAFIRSHDADAVRLWEDQNREALKQFWAASPGDALEVKKATEAKLAAGAKATGASGIHKNTFGPTPAELAAAEAEVEAELRRRDEEAPRRRDEEA